VECVIAYVSTADSWSSSTWCRV